MPTDSFSVIGEYLVRYSNGRAEATNGKHSFAASITEPLAIEYLENNKENAESFAQTSPDNASITITFHQLRGKIKLNRASLVLEALDELIPILPWVSAMAAQVFQLSRTVLQLNSRIERQDQLLDDMVVAKQENQNELLRRVHTLINSNIKKEESES